MRTYSRDSSVSSSSSSREKSSMTTFKSPPASHLPMTEEVLQSIVKGRRSWKSSGGYELVWPPKLEDALLKGLESYQPVDSRETRILGRFPLRNRFISDYIFATTGERRSPKQVGSRLQQLKVTETCNRQLLMSLISPLGPPKPASGRRALGRRAHHRSDSESTSNLPSRPITPTNPQNCDYDPKASMTIYIDLLPDSPSCSNSPSFEQPSAFGDNFESDMSSPFQQPRQIRSIDPTLTFLSQSPISAQSRFIVKSAGISVFSETTPLKPVGPAPNSDDGALLFSTTLVPGWWDNILDSPDPTQYTILQEVIHDDPRTECSAFSAVYKFRYSARSPVHPPSISSDLSNGLQNNYGPQDVSNGSYSLEALSSQMSHQRLEAFYDCVADCVESVWDSQGSYSPISVSPDQMSTYNSSPSSHASTLYDDSEILPSPVSGAFPVELANWGTHRVGPTYHHGQSYRCL